MKSVHSETDGPPEAVPAQSFSVRDYARTASGSHRAEIDLAPFAAAPLRSETLRALRYVAAVESATMGHLRNVLVTATHKDARVTAFLGTWAFEKFWIADALQHVIDAHDVTLPTPKQRSRVAAFFGEIRERVRPITGSIRANKLGEDMIAVHMTLGTIDEWMTQAALARIVALDPNPALATIVDRLLAVKQRQLEFFEAQARDRLAFAEHTRVTVARQIAGARWPIGAEAEAKSETDFFYSYLFASAPGIAAGIDAQISSLPGQEGLPLISRAVAAHAGSPA
jgi:hypothetical protein